MKQLTNFANSRRSQTMRGKYRKCLTLWDSTQLWLNTPGQRSALAQHSGIALSFGSTHSGTVISFGSTHSGTVISFGSTHSGTAVSFGLTHTGQYSALAQHTPGQRFSSAHSGIALCFGSRLSCTGLSSAWLNTGPWQQQCNRVQIVLEFLWQTSPKTNVTMYEYTVYRQNN